MVDAVAPFVLLQQLNRRRDYWIVPVVVTEPGWATAVVL